MGSKQALSNGNEPGELTDLLAAFEVQNKCKLTLMSSVQLHKGYLDTQWRLVAHGGVDIPWEAPHLALANVAVWGGDYKTLMGLLTRLLYAVDFQLALNEFEKIAPKKA